MENPNFRRDGDVLKKADSYSMGILLFTMVCGKFPTFSDQNYLTDECIPADLSDEVVDLMKKLVHPNYRARISIADALMHPWIVGSAPDVALQGKVVAGLRSFRFVNRFQKAIGIIAIGQLTESDRRKLKEGWDALDEKREGKITCDQLSTLFIRQKSTFGFENENAAVTRANSIFEKLDEENIGFITADQFMSVQVLTDMQAAEPELEIKAKDMFRMMDINHDGEITINELAAFLSDMNEQELKTLFLQADVNGNGSIDFNEFINAVTGFINSGRRSSHSLINRLSQKSFRRLEEIEEEQKE